MNRWWKAGLRQRRGQGPKRPVRRHCLALDLLEDRSVPSANGPFQHVLLLSVDGLHQADVADPALQSSLTNIQNLQQNGVSYNNASTTQPSDSFPGTLSYLTGAHPGTTGVYYDDSYSRTLFAPGSNVATATPGTEVTYFEAIDKNLNLINGGGNFDASSIDPSTLPLDSHGNPVYPNQFLKVNTIFDVAHQAGLYTAFSDKHPAYQIANGNDPKAINDFYAPEINSTTALLDPTTHHTVDANALLAANPYTDVSKYVLVDASTDPDGPNDPHLINDTTHNLLLTEAYDDLKVNAILREIDGKSSHGNVNNPLVPALFGTNFQAVSVAEKLSFIKYTDNTGTHTQPAGGITLDANGNEVPSQELLAALKHTDASIGRIVQELQNQGLYNSTLMVVTAKHGQNPRVGNGLLMADSLVPTILGNAGVTVAQQTADDVSLIWLANQQQTDAGVKALKQFVDHGTVTVYNQGTPRTVPAKQVIDKVLSGGDLHAYNLGDPAHDSTTPDIIVTLKPGYIFVGNPTHYQFKRAEHGGFSPDDIHDALIVSSGGLAPEVQGSVVNDKVETTQIAVTALNALGLDPAQLQGAVAEHTHQLSGLKLEELPVAPPTGLQQIDHFVIIYQENQSFDGLYGSFPGANGLQNAAAAGTIPQVDAAGHPLVYTPSPLNNGAIDPNFPSVIIGGKSYLAYPAIDANTGLPDPNAGNPVPIGPYNLAIYIQPSQKTGDIVHKFYHEQLQIDTGNPAIGPSNGSMDKFVAVSDNPGLVMSHFDATNLPEGLLAQQYTMDDNFFHAAYGGSFLNHQFLVAAAAPEWNQPIPSPNFVSHPAVNPALTDGGMSLPGHDSNLTGVDLLAADGNHFVVNTTFSANLVPTFFSPSNPQLLRSINDSNPNDPNRPYEPNIGDRLDAAGVSWKWYSGGWNGALAASPSNPANNGVAGAGADPNFQWHHQPLAYYDNFAPWVNGQRNPLSAAHLQDENNFFNNLSTGNLPAVSFIKQIGEDNEHPGYTNVLQGQQSTADIVHAIQNSSDWAHTAIIITYDENGGRWDHVSAPDANGIWGDGTRVPTIVISPYAQQGVVDHTQHDTLSILKTIEQRFNLPALSSMDANASSLADNFQSTPHVSIGTAYLQPDANNVGKNVLVVLGTEGDDHIQISPAGASQIEVRIDSVHLDQLFALAQISRIEVYGQGGNDHVEISSQVTLPAMIFAGDGNDHIQTGAGNTIVVGGTGNNHIEAGAGRNLLIGGTGNTHIEEHDGQAILIAGTTFYDANIEALTAIENEWASNDPLATRITKITGGVTQDSSNTAYHLAADTVFSNGYHNHLEAHSGMDWFFANPATDQLDQVFGSDVVTSI
jgi:acid phosphatase